MSLSPAFLDELRARTLLSALIAKTVKLQRAGREHRACCPFHDEKSPSFYVNDEKAFYHCLAAETVVMTRAGRTRIDALSGLRAEVLGPSRRWISAPIKTYGAQRLWEIQLSRNGVRKSLFATSRHRWFVRGRTSEILTTALTEGMRLQSATPEMPTAWTLDPAGVRHGILFGDGTMYAGTYGTINLHGDRNIALAHWFPDQVHHAKTREAGQPYFRIYGGRAFQHCKALPGVDAQDSYLLGFLAGYVAADGHVAKDGTVMLNSARRDHLEAVRDIAASLGIVTYGLTTQLRLGIDGKPSELHRIHFATSTLVPSFFLMDEARRRFEESSKAFDRLRWTVKSVTPTDRVEPVFCAEVPEDHAFALDDNILTGNCFGCGAHGDAIRWMTDQRGLPFIDAVKELAQSANLEMPAPDPRQAERSERAKSLHDVMAAAATWFEEQYAGLSGAAARAYVEQRGITDATRKAFALGYAPDSRTGLRRALERFGDAMLVEAGLLIQVDDKEPYDRFRDRLMIPIRDPRGRVIAFGGRIIGQGEPKYLNSPDTPLFDKGRTLYNLDRAAPAARKAGRMIVVEGYLDVIALARVGIDEAVAPLGTALTEFQLERLWRQVDAPLLCFDGDAAGQKAAFRAATRALPGLAPGRSLAFLTLPAGADPDDLVRTGGARAFEALADAPEPLVDRIWNHQQAAEPLATPEQRAGLRKRLNELVATIADMDVRQQYQAEFRRRFETQYLQRPARPPFQPGKRQPFRPGFQPMMPAQAETKIVGATGIDRVLVKGVVAGLLRFPDMLAAHAEALHALQLGDPIVARLLDALVDLALHEQALDTERLATILRSGEFDALARDLLRADRLPFSFTRKDADPDRARADLGEAIQVMIERPEIDAALQSATDRFMRTLEDDDRIEQQRLREMRDENARRLANLMQDDEGAN